MEKLGRDQIVEMYRTDVERLVYYLPWLQGKTGADVTTSYKSSEEMKTLSFPVYDGTLLNFLNELSTTVFMDTNYRYIYSRYRMKDWKDEITCIDKADIMTMDILVGIFSKYTLGGMTKAYLWTEGIEHGIFLKALLKAKSIIEYWDVPIPVPQQEAQPDEQMMQSEDDIEEQVEQPQEGIIEQVEQLEEQQELTASEEEIELTTNQIVSPSEEE